MTTEHNKGGEMIDLSKATLNKSDYAIIGQIIDRAAKVLGIDCIDRITVMMDHEALSINCPMDLPGMLAASDGNFLHDFTGISRHMDRETGKLKDCFLPRFALPAKRQGFGCYPAGWGLMG